MRIRMQSGVSSTGLAYSPWSSAVIGVPLDDRGAAAIAFAERSARKIHTISYSANPPSVKFDNEICEVESLANLIKDEVGEPLLLEATTLGFVEILLTLRAAKESGQKKVSILYTEPRSYRRSLSQLVLHRRDFELSDEVEDFSGVPGSLFMLRDDRRAKAVFLVGYEGQRLEQALEQTGVRPSDCSVVFGVPAFQAGWEMDSFANNIRVLRQRDVTGEVLFGGAQNPLSAYRAIARVHASCDRSRGERLIVAPIGTKPHGIGAAVFVCDHDDVGLIYDHPRRSSGRSDDVASWHLFEVGF